LAVRALRGRGRGNFPEHAHAPKSPGNNVRFPAPKTSDRSTIGDLRETRETRRTLFTKSNRLFNQRWQPLASVAQSTSQIHKLLTNSSLSAKKKKSTPVLFAPVFGKSMVAVGRAVSALAIEIKSKLSPTSLSKRENMHELA